jgi:hypothetical protein
MAIWRDLFSFLFLSSQVFFPLLEAYSYTSSMTGCFFVGFLAFLFSSLGPGTSEGLRKCVFLGGRQAIR